LKLASRQIYKNAVDAKTPGFASLFRLNRQIYADSYSTLLKKYSLPLVKFSKWIMRLEEMSQRLTALVTASAIPAVRWFDSSKPDARNAVSHFRHFNMQIDIAVDATQVSGNGGSLILVGENELRTFAERLGSCSRFTTTPFDKMRDLSITVKLLKPVPAQAALSSKSLQLLDVLR